MLLVFTLSSLNHRCLLTNLYDPHAILRPLASIPGTLLFILSSAPPLRGLVPAAGAKSPSVSTRLGHRYTRLTAKRSQEPSSV